MPDLLPGRTSLKQLLPLAVHYTKYYVQMHADTFHKRIVLHAHTETEMHAWMDAHNSYIIEVDKILLKDDCEDEFHLRLQS